MNKYEEEFIINFVKHFHEDMSDTESQGPNFTWDRFPDIAATFALTACRIHLPSRFTKSPGEELKTFAKSEALKIIG